MLFKNRYVAGQFLARLLAKHHFDKKTVIVALPRGGVVVAEAVANTLHLPLDVLLLRKLPHPEQPELAVGAVAENGLYFINAEFQDAVRLDPVWFKNLMDGELSVIRERARLYRSRRPTIQLQGRSVVLVDDGIATGATMKVAILAARNAGASRVIIAVPVASPSVLPDLMAKADEVITLDAPKNFAAVGQAYQDFTPVTDKDVCAILDRTAQS